jgi:hypothetical protein
MFSQYTKICLQIPVCATAGSAPRSVNQQLQQLLMHWNDFLQAIGCGKL